MVRKTAAPKPAP